MAGRIVAVDNRLPSVSGGSVWLLENRRLDRAGLQRFKLNHYPRIRRSVNRWAWLDRPLTKAEGIRVLKTAGVFQLNVCALGLRMAGRPQIHALGKIGALAKFAVPTLRKAVKDLSMYCGMRRQG